MQTSIRRAGNRIEDVLAGMMPQEVETAGRVEAAEGSKEYAPLLAQLERYLLYVSEERDEYAPISSMFTDVLTPQQINIFLQLTRKFENNPNYYWCTGNFISQLIQNSFNNGHNHFQLDCTDLPELVAIGYRLKGRDNNLIKITVTGKTGNFCGAKSSYIALNVQETGENFGAETTGSILTASNIGKYCGFKTAHTTFKTSNPETLQQMLADVPAGNRVIFIDGEEQVMREYDGPPNRN